LAKTKPHIAFKYLGEYLALSLSQRSRLEILLNHYYIISCHMVDNFAEMIINDEFILWECFNNQNTYKITLRFPFFDMEGDLSLLYYCNSERLCIISFAFAPGNSLNIPIKQVLFITHVQGRGGHFSSYRHATKSLMDISPRAMLLVAVQAIAIELGLSNIIGISAKDQCALGRISPFEPFCHDYDEFWQEHGGEKINDNAFLFPVPLTYKPLSLIKSNHRQRTRHKREFKNNVMDQVRLTFGQKCVKNHPVNC
jgi:hypothetical protein